MPKLDLDPNARHATFDGRRHVLHLWENRFERTPRSCASFQQAKELVEASEIPQTLYMQLKPVYRR